MIAASVPAALCYVCGSPELAAGADLRSPTCEADVNARQHVVSMQRAQDGDSLAVCPCGWQNKAPRGGRYADQDAAVRAHWLGQRKGPEA